MQSNKPENKTSQKSTGGKPKRSGESRNPARDASRSQDRLTLGSDEVESKSLAAEMAEFWEMSRRRLNR